MSVLAREEKNIVIFDEFYESLKRRALFRLNCQKNRIECTMVDDTVFPRNVYMFTIDRCVKYNEADDTDENISEPSAIWKVLQVNDRLQTLAFFKEMWKSYTVSYEMDIARIQLYGKKSDYFWDEA